MTIKLKNFSFGYVAGSMVLENFNLEVSQNSIHGIVGMSGSGKSTLLKILSGIISSSGAQNHREKISFVFQESNLLPWLTVEQNLLICHSNISNVHFLDTVKFFRISEFLNLYPHQLSGGMAQKVNLARAFLGKPSLVLLDEPFSHLDQSQRDLFLRETLEWWKRNPCTIIFVSHNIDEMLYLAQEITFLNKSNKSMKNELFGIEKTFLKEHHSYLNRYQAIYSEIEVV